MTPERKLKKIYIVFEENLDGSFSYFSAGDTHRVNNVHESKLDPIEKWALKVFITGLEIIKRNGVNVKALQRKADN